VKITPGEVVYDFCWHPTGVNRHTSVSAGCFVTTARDHPVHMWDTTSGAIRCSYRAFDHVVCLFFLNIIGLKEFLTTEFIRFKQPHWGIEIFGYVLS